MLDEILRYYANAYGKTNLIEAFRMREKGYSESVISGFLAIPIKIIPDCVIAGRIILDKSGLDEKYRERKLTFVLGASY